jgi:hypothetical protein
MSTVRDRIRTSVLVALAGVILLRAAACDGTAGLTLTDGAPDAAGDAAAGADGGPGADVGGAPDAGPDASGDDAGPAADALADGPVLRVDPTALEFGPSAIGRRRTLPLALRSSGRAPVVVTGIAFAAGASPDFAVDTSTLGEGGQPLSPAHPLTILPNDVRTIAVTYTPDVQGEVDEETGEPILDRGTLVLDGDLTDGPVRVAVSGYGVSVDCPVAVIEVEEGAEVVPGTTLHLRGDQSYTMVGDIRRWEWRVAQPSGAQSLFIPSPTFVNPTFDVYGSGMYTFYLDVWNEEGQKSCEPAIYEVVMIPDASVHIELLWTTPGDPDETAGAGADLDLHLVNPHAPTDPAAPDHDGDGLPDPYFDPTYDCWAGNPAPDWGTAGAERDDGPRWSGGGGGERIDLNMPENGLDYEIAVHYPEDHDLGASFVTIRVYIYQILVFQLRDVQLDEGDLWCVASIDWPSGQVRLCEARTGGGYRITPDYPAP